MIGLFLSLCSYRYCFVFIFTLIYTKETNPLIIPIDPFMLCSGAFPCLNVSYRRLGKSMTYGCLQYTQKPGENFMICQVEMKCRGNKATFIC
jgi:hypothetical protein